MEVFHIWQADVNRILGTFPDVTGGKAPLTVIKKLSNKARQYIKCVKKAKGHLQRLGDENDRER